MNPTLSPERTNQQRFENYMRDNDYILPQPEGYVGSYSATKDTIHFTYRGGEEFYVIMLPTDLRKYQGEEGSRDLLEMLESRRRLNHNNL